VASSLTLHLSWADTVEKQIGLSARPKDIAYIKGVLFDIAFPPVKERVPIRSPIDPSSGC
jgi:hypothetical protein